MNLLLRTSLVLLLFSFGPAAPVRATENPGPPAAVVLDGLTSILGDPRVFLQVSAPGAPAEDILLGFGQTVRGIKLLAVDAVAATVTIDNAGLIQTLKICAPPVLNAAPSAGEPSAGDESTIVSRAVENRPRLKTGALAQTAGQTIREAAVGGGVSSAGVSANNSASASAATAADNQAAAAAPDSSAGGDDNASGNHIYYYWQEAAQKIEQARLATAAQVLAGTLPAQPLTPLTPASTPAGLIGADSLFMDHGRGIVVSN